MKKSLKTIVAISALSLALGAALAVGVKAEVKAAKADEISHIGTVYVDTYASYTHNTENNWESGNAKFAVYFTDDSSKVWTSFMTAVDGVSHMYQASYSLNFNPTKIIAVRFNPEDQTPGWNGSGHVYNQTQDISGFVDNLIIQIQDNNFNWGFIYGADNWYVKGSMTNWNQNESYRLAMRRNDDGVLDFYSTTIEMDKDDEFKVSNVSYNSFYGYDTLRSYEGMSAKEKGHVSGDGSSNVKVEKGGTYDVYVDTNQKQPIWVQIDSENEILDFCDRFLEAMRDDDVCGSDRSKENDDNHVGIDTVWSTFKTEFDQHTTDGAISYFKTSANATIKDARDLYLHIVGKYGISYSWTKGPTTSGGYVLPVINGTIIESTNYTAVIILASTLALVAVGGYFLLRKARKED